MLFAFQSRNNHIEKESEAINSNELSFQVSKAVIVLNLPETESSPSKGLRPHDFPSRKAYRQALIEQRTSAIARSLCEVKSALRELSLQVIGGTTSNVVVVEGPDKQIRKARDIEGVLQVIVDQPVLL